MLGAFSRIRKQIEFNSEHSKEIYESSLRLGTLIHSGLS